MAVYEEVNDNRPPPKPQRTIRLTTPGIPWYRDLRILRIIAQIAFAIAFFGGLFFAFANLNNNLEGSPLAIDFGIYSRPFTIAVAEGISITEDWGWIEDVDFVRNAVSLVLVGLAGLAGYNAFGQYRHQGKVGPYTALFGGLSIVGLVLFWGLGLAENLSNFLQDYLYGGSMVRAFVTGVWNTIRVVIVSLIACTIVGILVGIGLLSNNFLVRNVSLVYVEIFRNTPLLVQLFFVSSLLTIALPRPINSIFSPDSVGPITLNESLWALNTQGFYFVWVETTNSFPFLAAAFLIGLVAARFVWVWRLNLQENTGKPARAFSYAMGTILGATLIGWLLAGGWPLGGGPFDTTYPTLDRRQVQGGTSFSLPFMSLFIGLTIYTSAFIADIVRAGIQSVPRGQLEAARSQGFKGNQVLNLVVLPQALRLIIPPLGNQYVNLGKNSSLGLVVSYVDTFQIAQLANNESGQAIPFFVGLMTIYLSISLVLSVLTNMFNQTTRLKTR